MAWVGQRQCRLCAFAGPETEFQAATILDDGAAFVGRADEAPADSLDVCGGCATTLLTVKPLEARQRILTALMDRERRWDAFLQDQGPGRVSA